MTSAAVEREAAIIEAETYLASVAAGDLDVGSDDLTITGRAMNYGSTPIGQRGATRFMPNALGSQPFKVPLCWQHDMAKVLGVATLIPDKDGLKVDARLANTAAGRDAVALMRNGGLSGFSIGWDCQDAHHEGGVRLVTQGHVHEVSLVTAPADPKARVESVNGQAVPKYLHAAPPLELEVLDFPRESTVRAALAEAEEYLRISDLEHAAWTSTSEMLFGMDTEESFERQQARADQRAWEAALREQAERHPRNSGAW
jgi:hypothetical protein